MTGKHCPLSQKIETKKYTGFLSYSKKNLDIGNTKTVL
jgi:hypothetical protein